MSASQAAQNRKGEKVPSVLSDTISRRDALLVEVHPRSVQTMSPEELILVQAKLGFGINGEFFGPCRECGGEQGIVADIGWHVAFENDGPVVCKAAL